MSKVKWKATKVQFLVKDEISGRYYARFWRDGKAVWRTLKTDIFEMAKYRLAEELKAFRAVKNAARAVERGDVTVSRLIDAYLDSQRLRPDITKSSLRVYESCVAALRRTWPELAIRRPKDVTEAACQQWAKRYSEHCSATRYNNTVDRLRKILDIGISQGLLYRNPAARLAKQTARPKHVDVPTSDEFATVVRSVREAGAWCSQQCGDLIEFLAFSGARIGEARQVRWDDIEPNGIWITGGETGTKNHERRFVPFNAKLRALVTDLRDNPRLFRGEREGYVLAISECQEAIDIACQRLAVKRFTHHDLRHLFITRAIESNIDVPTVAKWVGHKDGGALLMRTYSHLLQEHSQAMAAKLTF
jgi:integrase